MSEHWTPARSALQDGVCGLTIDDVAVDSKATSSRMTSESRAEEPLITPIYHSSTYKIPSVSHYLDILKDGGYIYSRLGNPTCRAAEAAISSLEGGEGALVFCSGMGAISTTLWTFLQAGDHVVVCNPVYSGTHFFVRRYLSKYNIEVSWVESGQPVEEYRKALKPNTKLLYGETPCNPLISVLDLEEFGKLGQSLEGVVTMVDSTYASPYLQQPHQYGIDLVMHSATKFLGGHSDLLAGVVSARTEEMWKKLMIARTTMGTVLSPFEATLVSRGIKTLPVRMERHCSNAQKVAEYLEKQPKVSVVYYPGLTSHPGHHTASRQMRRFGSMIAFEMKDGLEAATRVVQNVRLIQLAVSLGGVESLIEHPATMTHGPMVMTDEERKEALISDGLIRFSVGLEDVDDLIKDLEYALEKA